jgi:hypothetical protein
MFDIIIKMSWRFLNYIYKIYDSWTNVKLEADTEKKAAKEKAEKEKIKKLNNAFKNSMVDLNSENEKMLQKILKKREEEAKFFNYIIYENGDKYMGPIRHINKLPKLPEKNDCLMIMNNSHLSTSIVYGKYIWKKTNITFEGQIYRDNCNNVIGHGIIHYEDGSRECGYKFPSHISEKTTEKIHFINYGEDGKIIGGYYCQGLFKHVYKNDFPISYNYYDKDGNNVYDERANKRNKIIEGSRMRILFNKLGKEKGLKLGTKDDINQILISVGY